MNGTDNRLDVDRLVREIQRYLVVVDLLRSAGYSPSWRGERARSACHDPRRELMMHLRHPSPALVVAVVALFVSLSGTAVAAGVVPWPSGR
jgi:hypothetical protein